MGHTSDWGLLLALLGSVVLVASVAWLHAQSRGEALLYRLRGRGHLHQHLAAAAHRPASDGDGGGGTVRFPGFPHLPRGVGLGRMVSRRRDGHAGSRDDRRRAQGV